MVQHSIIAFKCSEERGFFVERELFYKNYSQIKKILKKAYETQYYKELIDGAHIDLERDIQYEDFLRIKCSSKNDYHENKFQMCTGELALFLQKEYQDHEEIREKDACLKEHGLQLKVTSGSTGQPLEVLKSNQDIAKDYLSLNMHRRRLTNYDFTGKFMWVWPANPYTVEFFNSICEMNTAIVVNKYGYQFFLYEHSEDNMEKLYRAMIDCQCEWLTSSPSVLYNFANYICEKELTPPELKYIECHSEKLYDWQRETIKSVFKIDPISIYSSNEIQFIGTICEQGNLHIFSNSCFVEFINSTKTQSKEICVTSLLYTDLPIIRYKLGDCGDWLEEGRCSCDFCKYPAAKLSGFRTNDFIITKNGTYMEPFVIVDSIFFLLHIFRIEIKEYKVVECAYDKFEYYLPKAILQKYNDIIIPFIHNYLSYVLDYPITVVTKEYEADTSVAVGMKYRYFEVRMDDSIQSHLLSNNEKK